MTHVKVTDVSARYKDGSTMQLFNLVWEHNGSVYLFEDLFPDVLLKYADGKRRRLDAHAACNVALIKQARSLAIQHNLYEKATKVAA
jgi:hypothetical protein